MKNGSVIWQKKDSSSDVWTAAHVPGVPGLEVDITPVKTKPEWTLGRIHMMGLRRMTKIFLSHLWHVWREMEGLSTQGPYVQEKLGHTSILDPWKFVEPKKEPQEP